MSDINTYTCTGRLGMDPEMRHLQSGASVTSFRIAIGSKFKTKSGEPKETTTWLEVEAWGPVGEVIQKYMQKGSRIAVSGTLEQDEWEDKNTGQKRSKHKLRLRDFTFLDSKGDNNGGGGNRSIQNESPRQSRQPDAAPPAHDIPASEIPF